MRDVRARMLAIAHMLNSGQRLTSAIIRDHFGVSFSTAKRDITVVEQTYPGVRCLRSDRNGELHYDYERALYLPPAAR